MTPSVSAETTRQDFLNLLVTQLKNQDPLQPASQYDQLGQLAQFSTLEGIEKLNANFDQLLRLQQLTQGADLIGRQVAFNSPDDSGQQVGVVDAVDVTSGQINLAVNGQAVPLSNVLALIG